MLREDEWRATFRVLGLSMRERQIVRGVFDDHSEQVIADDLGISPHTVHTHLERLYHKTGVGSRCALVVRVVAAYLAWRDRQG
jgi:DNA-binding CsgD family transcriptional regulator